jgi:hypothetical protein
LDLQQQEVWGGVAVLHITDLGARADTC